ncbi:alpha/beta hydrolase [Croceicoccus marinus]|jgi:pimeloyl-ACP methyl ester carboxylesterase|uniref:Palmitoyl-protein thioesterase ABHD10, mitochondrial n=1 Tax=Croceicoccus marinus TaxID=450378 RepID=A0A7G6VVE8_9SPHN|nr:alpha/beta hydrolase [Croceicoccus marinus]QNE05713.1 alpha/beta hydrolase [Croceicoccus marinus]
MSETAAPLPEISRCPGPDGLTLAFRHAEGAGPLIVFLPGYMSDMAGSKAEAVLQWAAERGRGCLLLDYSGCGNSAGRFADGTLSRWRDEVLHLIDHVGAGTAERPVLLIGSSMGGWLMLLVARALIEAKGGAALAGMIGIAAAPDFTRWGHGEEQRALLASGKVLYEDNPYGPEPTPTHPGFFADAEAQLLLDEPLAIAAPTRLLHGQRDAVVPWEISIRLADALAGENVRILLVKDGDHRLSREQDIKLLLSTLEELLH